jgi:tetratricopeptide (TPR) repeat protein
MDINIILNSVKMAVGQGELERALAEFVQLLQSDPKFSDILNTALINQRIFRETKDQVLKGTISLTDARQANNQVTDNLLHLVENVERGDLVLTEKVTGETVRKIRWQYFVIGALVAGVAGFAIWNYYFAKHQTCPNWGKDHSFHVMILPFKKLGKSDGNKIEPETEMVDLLNKYSEKNGLEMLAGVSAKFDIEKEYPNSAAAKVLAAGCEADMIIWGKINQKAEDNYTIDVQYKIISGKIESKGDTSFTRLIRRADDGAFSEDIKKVSDFLFVVIANRLQRSDVALKIMEKSLSILPVSDDPTGVKTASLTTVDTSFQMQAGYTFAASGLPKKAAEAYSKVLEVNPKHWSARQNRGLARFKSKDFEGAAIDLEMAQTASNLPLDAGLLKIQTEANLASNRFESAEKSLESYKKLRGGADKWSVEKKTEYDQKMAIAEKDRKVSEQVASKTPNDPKANLRAAKTNLKVGNDQKATEFADKTLKKQPKNLDAWAVKVEAAASESGQDGAQKVVKEAQQKGVEAKDIAKFRPVIAPLLLGDVPEN